MSQSRARREKNAHMRLVLSTQGTSVEHPRIPCPLDLDLSHLGPARPQASLAHNFDPRCVTSAVECVDGLGLCTLDANARTLQRLALPRAADTRWATPIGKGCGIWGLVGAGSDLRLVIQQRDGTFASADLPNDASATSLAEGGAECEVAYYQSDYSSGAPAAGPH